jgi:hypothetical protein
MAARRIHVKYPFHVVVSGEGTQNLLASRCKADGKLAATSPSHLGFLLLSPSPPGGGIFKGYVSTLFIPFSCVHL